MRNNYTKNYVLFTNFSKLEVQSFEICQLKITRTSIVVEK